MRRRCSECDGALATDNPGPLCSPCQKKEGGRATQRSSRAWKRSYAAVDENLRSPELQNRLERARAVLGLLNNPHLYEHWSRLLASGLDDLRSEAHLYLEGSRDTLSSPPMGDALVWVQTAYALAIELTSWLGAKNAQPVLAHLLDPDQHPLEVQALMRERSKSVRTLRTWFLREYVHNWPRHLGWEATRQLVNSHFPWDAFPTKDALRMAVRRASKSS